MTNKVKWYQNKWIVGPIAFVVISVFLGFAGVIKPTALTTSVNKEATPVNVLDNKLSNTSTYINKEGNTVHSPAYSDNGQAPDSATAQCGDGTYSFSQNHSGTCSHHGGVSVWLPLANEDKETVSNTDTLDASTDSYTYTPDPLNFVTLGSSVVTQNNIDFSFRWEKVGQVLSGTDVEVWGNKTTQGFFVDVGLKINNKDFDSLDINIHNFYLTDQAGRVYHPEQILYCGETPSRGMYSTYYWGKNVTLKPSIPCVSLMLFEVSQDTTAVNLDFAYTK